jgi:hypothetical protein
MLKKRPRSEQSGFGLSALSELEGLSGLEDEKIVSPLISTPNKLL